MRAAVVADGAADLTHAVVDVALGETWGS